MIEAQFSILPSAEASVQYRIQEGDRVMRMVDDAQRVRLERMRCRGETRDLVQHLRSCTMILRSILPTIEIFNVLRRRGKCRIDAVSFKLPLLSRLHMLTRAV